MKTCSPTDFPTHRAIYLSQLLKTNLLFETSLSDTTTIYLFKFSHDNSRIKCEICSKLKIEAPEVNLVCLLLTVNIFDIMF